MREREEETVKPPSIRISAVVDGEEVFMMRIIKGEPVKEAEEFINRWGVHKIVRQVYGIPKGESLHEFLCTGEAPWEE